MVRSVKISARVLVGVAAGAMLSLTACNNSFTIDTTQMVIDKDLLSAEVQAQLTKKLGKQAPTIDCPEALAATVGATTTCLMGAPDGNYNVTVTVTELQPGAAGNYDTGNAVFDAQVADKPNP